MDICTGGCPVTYSVAYNAVVTIQCLCMSRRRVSKGEVAVQQRLFSFSLRKRPEWTLAIDGHRNGRNGMCFSKPVSRAVSSCGPGCALLFTSTVVVC